MLEVSESICVQECGSEEPVDSTHCKNHWASSHLAGSAVAHIFLVRSVWGIVFCGMIRCGSCLLVQYDPFGASSF
jgi:hypothetical protein